jgi:hypothetical protein
MKNIALLQKHMIFIFFLVIEEISLVKKYNVNFY